MHRSGGASEELLKVIKLEKRAGEMTNTLILISTVFSVVGCNLRDGLTTNPKVLYTTACSDL